ncbi:MAG TPA: PorV/PorQ family protein [Gemmatimonadales bacterium]|nr:PorV/PorQ family protein [Gemmatimonadales bacterium]
MRRNRSDRRPDGLTAGRTVIALLMLAAGPSARPAVGQDQPLNAGALFLVFPVGAQSVGMGQTAIAAAGRGEAAFWNPAGLATLGEDEFALHSATLVAGRSHVLGAYFPSRGIGVIGGAVYLVDYGDLDRTDNNGQTIARIAPRNFEFLATYATSLGGSFVLGVSYKLIQFRVDCSGDCRDFPAGTGATHALDFGGQFRVGPGGPLRVGVALRNVGFRLQVQNQAQADPLPTRLAVGAQYELRLRPATGRTLDQAFDLKLAADVDSPWGEVGQSETRFGIDIGYQRLVRLRAGYAFVQEGLSGPSVGIGVESGSLGIDLARAFLTGSELQAESPTFFSFRVTF